MESFAEYTGRDETLKNLIAAGKKMSAAEQLEALVALGDAVRIGEELYPAPTLGTLVLLEVMQSPFVTGGAEVSGRDVLRGCLVLKLREAAIPPLLAVKQTAIGAESQKAEWEEFDRIAMERISIPDSAGMVQMAKDLGLCLCFRGGFALLPQNREKKTEAAGNFNLEYLTEIAAMTAEAFPAVTPFEAVWRIPYVMIGFLVMQAARRRGVRGIGRPEQSRAVWERFRELKKSYGEKGRS